jgi:hypothetical protein
MLNVQKIGFVLLSTVSLAISNPTPAHAGFVEDLSGAITNSIMDGIFGKKKAPAPVQQVEMKDITLEAQPIISTTDVVADPTKDKYAREKVFNQVADAFTKKVINVYPQLAIGHDAARLYYPQMTDRFHDDLEIVYQNIKNSGSKDISSDAFMKMKGLYSNIDNQTIVFAVLTYQIQVGDETLESVLNE